MAYHVCREDEGGTVGMKYAKNNTSRNIERCLVNSIRIYLLKKEPNKLFRSMVSGILVRKQKFSRAGIIDK